MFLYGPVWIPLMTYTHHLVETDKSAPSHTYSGLEVYQDSPGNVAGVIALIVEYILAIAAFGCKVLEVTVLTNTMLLAKLLPKLTTDCWKCQLRTSRGRGTEGMDSLLLPHWPA